MRKLVVNSLLLIVIAWYALLDQCLIKASGMPITGKILVLLIFQIIIWTLLLLLLNGAFSVTTEAAHSIRGFRFKFLVFGVPAIIFLVSPVLISETLNQARYGYLDKFLVNSHVADDLRCCLLNPFICGSRKLCKWKRTQNDLPNM